MLGKIAGWCYRHRWRTVVIWLVALIGLSAVAQGALGGGDFNAQFSVPASEGKDVVDLLTDAFPDRDSRTDAQIVIKAEQGVADPVVRDAFAALLDRVRDEKPDVSITSPYDPGGERLVSESGQIAYAELSLPKVGGQAAQEELGREIRDAAAGPLPAGVEVAYGGDIFVEFEFPESEAIGVLAAIIILVLAFGSVLAMGLSIGTALIGLAMGAALVTISSTLITTPDFSLQLSAMIGLGVGIDYALFIVTRYREQLRTHSPFESTVLAIDTAGRAVLFAGITVMISLMGMLLMGLRFIQGLAIAGSLSVGVMVIASLTLLPALLGFVRERIDVTTRAALVALVVFAGFSLLGVIFLGSLAYLGLGLIAAVAIVALSYVVRSLRTPLRRREPRPVEQQFWYRWSRFIQHRPWPMFIVGLVVLVVMAIPLFSLRLGFTDNGNRAEWQTSRQAYDLLAEGFGPGFNGPLQLVAVVDADTDPATLADISATVAATPGVRAVSPPIPLTDTLVLWRVVPDGAPQDESTTELVHHLRDDVIPAATAESGTRVLVGGFTAIAVDLSDYFSKRLFLFISAVLVLSFLLLMLVFRSVLVPLKAVILNLLSIGAAYGLVVAIFQWGWGAGIIDIGKEGPIEPFIPMMLFAIVFGLSMDYEVFLLSRMREAYDRSGDNAEAVADGLAATARVITAAALIMVFVFGSFVAGDDRIIKLFGLGLAAAVFIDATIVRMVLVPATMELLGARNWWIPKWLDRVLPTIDVEGHRDDDVAHALTNDSSMS